MNFFNLSLQNLHDQKRYEFQIDKMFNKIKEEKGLGALFDISQDDVPFFSFGYDRESLARELAISVRKEEFRLSPPLQKKIVIKAKNKVRIVYLYKPLDKIVLGVLGKLLTELFTPFLNKNVFSYRKGFSAKNEVIEFCRFIKKEMPLSQSKGLYILQTDIASYSDEVNLKDNSPLWTILEEGFQRLKIVPTPYQWYLIKEAFRPSYLTSDGDHLVNLKGAPTGSPITPMLYNFFVSRIDYYLSYEPTIFYARYSDDIIICHPDKEIVESYEFYLNNYLSSISLSLSPKKTERIFFSPSGAPTSDLRWRGTNSLSLLGHNVEASGLYSLSISRINKFLEKMRFRLKNTKKLLINKPLSERGKVFCSVVNDLFDDPSMGSSMKILRKSTDLNLLKSFDHSIAQCIVENLTGTLGPKAFREVAYKRLRSEWGLKSLLQMRVEAYKEGRKSNLVLT